MADERPGKVGTLGHIVHFLRCHIAKGMIFPKSKSI